MLSLKPRLALALLLVVGVFTADLFEPADNVSICFAYTLPILLGVYMGPGSTFRLAALATAASLVGSFIRPPEGGIVLSFVVNRVIAVAAQWLVAFLVEQRRRNHALVDARLTEERLVAETGRRFVQILTHEIATALTAIDGQGYRLGKLAQTTDADGHHRSQREDPTRRDAPQGSGRARPPRCRSRPWRDLAEPRGDRGSPFPRGARGRI